jgi:hypothetical protein
MDSRRSRAPEEQTRPRDEEPAEDPSLEKIMEARRSESDEEMRIEFEELSARAGSNGVRDVPARTVGDEPNDEVHIIATQPDDVEPPAVEDMAGEADEEEDDEMAHHGDIAPASVQPAARAETTPAEADEEAPMSPIPNLMIQVAEPGVIAHIADAMDAIGDSVEYVALIHLKIAYDDTATTVPTEAARVLVAQSIKECVRFEDKVSRVGENSFVVVARLRPGSPEPAFIERRLVKAARRATGWNDSGPSFRTDHLVVDADSIDDPEDVLLALLHP